MRLEKASPLVYSYQSTRPDAENQLPKNASRSCRKLKKQIVFGLDPPIMPTTLSFADFSMSRAASELRYDNAYLIYDRTGQVIQEARGHFTNFKVTSATPNESTFLSDEGSFGLQLGSCRFISDKADASLESFGSSCKRYFDIVAELLDIRMFTRVGLRVITKKTTKDKEEAKALLRSLHLANLPSTMRFGASEDPEEIMFRWESSQIGALIRLKAETTTVDVILPPELELSMSNIHRSVTGLTLDVDYYTVAPVERSQWDATAWITQSMRFIKKETTSILGG